MRTERESAVGEILRIRRLQKRTGRNEVYAGPFGPLRRLNPPVFPAAYFIFLTFDALGPFGPFTTSNSTLWPSDKDLKPSL